jgi:Protein of unknown function (DUF3096)
LYNSWLVEARSYWSIYGAESEIDMNLSISIAPLMALIAGIAILIVPRLLSYIVAIYLIAIGLLGLFGGSNMHFS